MSGVQNLAFDPTEPTNGVSYEVSYHHAIYCWRLLNLKVFKRNT